MSMTDGIVSLKIGFGFINFNLWSSYELNIKLCIKENKKKIHI